MAEKRRLACPQTVLHTWDAIASIKQQRQVPNLSRLSSYMKRIYNTDPTDLEQQLKNAVEDELVLLKEKIGCKGAKVGVKQDGYDIPDVAKEKDGHDWYCFVCHQGGEMLLCSTCHRVFHEDCLPDKTRSDKFICPACKPDEEKFAVNIKKSELNTLLGFTCIRLKEKTRELHRIPHPDDERWRYDFLIYEQMDLVMMEDKMKSNEYTRLVDFFTDAQQVVHNVMVYFGTNSRLAVLARQMIGDCEYDLLEIVQCANCYKMSNMKNDAFWFCQPCDPPHELVYAKVPRFPYWPAKVIKKFDTSYDVRFFGAFHQRAYVEESSVKPISTPFQKLGVKKTESFQRAYKELRHHQNLVEEALKKGTDKQNDEISEDLTDKTDSDTAMNSATAKPKMVSRKRKSTTTPVTKPPAAKKPATVPIKKNKKFYQESPTSSSPKNNTTQDSVGTPEEHDQNLVSSSSQETAVNYVSIEVQTDNEVVEEASKEKKAQKDEAKSSDKEKSCDCSVKYEKLLKDLQTRLEAEHKEDKCKALKEFSDKLHKEMEKDKQKHLSSALEKLQSEQKDALRKSEEQLKAAQEVHLAKLAEQHKIDISETKKKQWCYNCEAEAIYHCCWNTSYCSVECQQVHWHKEHKRTCRRKR